MDLSKIETQHSSDEAWILAELEKHGVDHFNLPGLGIDLAVCLFRRLERIEQKLDEVLASSRQ